MKVLSAVEDTDGGVIAAVVEFEDGATQSVQVPSWATQDNIIEEARRCRARNERQQAARLSRSDLLGSKPAIESA